MHVNADVDAPVDVKVNLDVYAKCGLGCGCEWGCGCGSMCGCGRGCGCVGMDINKNKKCMINKQASLSKNCLLSCYMRPGGPCKQL